MLLNVTDSAGHLIEEMAIQALEELKRMAYHNEAYGHDEDADGKQRIQDWETLLRAVALSRHCEDVTLEDDGPLFVCAYEVSRERGGAEEGGWYFDRYEFVNVVDVWTDGEEARNTARQMTKAEEMEKAKNFQLPRYSVIGTPDTIYRAELYPRQSQTWVRPFYH